MNPNTLVSLPIIAFSIFALVVETLGYEITFDKFYASFVKAGSVFDWIGVQAMFLSAIVYAGSLASTAGITFVEGLTWFRPGNMMAPLLGYIFGIPGCVGVALGNLLADSFSGHYSVGSVGGFIGNFMLAYIPHKVLSDPPLRQTKGVARYCLFVGIGSTLISAYVIVGLLALISSAGIDYAIPVIGGVPPSVQVLSEDALWSSLFTTIATNNFAMSLIAGILIVASFRYFTEKGLFWRDRVGLFEAKRARLNLFVSLSLTAALCYVIYDLSVRLGVYGRIGRSENYVANLLGISFFVVGVLGVVFVSTNSVKNRILSILIGSESVDARALEVYLASRRQVLKKEALDEATGERLGALLFSKVLQPDLGKLLRRVRVPTFIDDYLKHIMLYMMNSLCFVRKGATSKSRIISIEECVICKGVSGSSPACGLIVGFSRGLARSFADMKGESLTVSAVEVECKAAGDAACKVQIGWE
jgi:energy-coupling factor transport system substrate-specific component